MLDKNKSDDAQNIPTVTETSPGKVIEIKALKLQQLGAGGGILKMTGTTFDLLEMVVNHGNIPQGGLSNTESVKRWNLWNAIDAQKPESPEVDEKDKEAMTELTLEEIVKKCPQIIISEKKYKSLQKIMKGMKWNMSGQDIVDFIKTILPDIEDDDDE